MPKFIGSGGDNVTGESRINVGPVIKSCRKSLGWSQKCLAEKSGVTREYVNMLEQGRRTCSLEALQRIATALGKNAYDLLAAVEGEKEKFELGLLLKEIVASENTDYLKEVVSFAQELAAKKEAQSNNKK